MISAFAVQKCVLGSSPDSIPPYFVTVFKSMVHSTRLFKNELSHTCTLVVDFGDLITKIYQSPPVELGQGRVIPDGPEDVPCKLILSI